VALPRLTVNPSRILFFPKVFRNRPNGNVKRKLCRRGVVGADTLDSAGSETWQCHVSTSIFLVALIINEKEYAHLQVYFRARHPGRLFAGSRKRHKRTRSSFVKSKRTMTLMSGDKALKTYRVSLGTVSCWAQGNPGRPQNT